jgi:hypothetical protein
MLDIQPHLLFQPLACCQVSYEELLKYLIVVMSLLSPDLTCMEYRWFHGAPEQTYTRGAGPHPGPLAHCPPQEEHGGQSINQTILDTYYQN